MSDRDFWLLVRRALLLVVKAIEQRWGLGDCASESMAVETIKKGV